MVDYQLVGITLAMQKSFFVRGRSGTTRGWDGQSLDITCLPGVDFSGTAIFLLAHRALVVVEVVVQYCSCQAVFCWDFLWAFCSQS